MRQLKSKLIATTVAVALAGCGTLTPDLYLRETEDTAIAVNKLVNHVRCQLATAIDELYQQFPNATWLPTWGAKVTLKVTVLERSDFNPGVSVGAPLSTQTRSFSNGTTRVIAQNLSVAAGGSFSAEATRTETLSYYYTFDEFTDPSLKRPCRFEDGVLIQSDFKLKEWIEASILSTSTPGTIRPVFVDEPPVEYIQQERAFVVTMTGGATPKVQLVNVTANTTSPFLGATRKHTDNILITMGPTEEIFKKRTFKADPSKSVSVPAKGPSEAVRNADLAAQIGQAVKSLP
ncbi:hypothetical protein [Hoeflea sp.]|uniref:hypothetical protein n=1 Tax=Hoeflea sp. TaxID=1940281 RepID=UPI003B025BEE